MNNTLYSIKKKKLIINTAKGIYLYSGKKKITDLTAGSTGHAILGWGNKKIINGIKNQAKKYCHIDYKTYIDPNREKLSKLLLSNKANNLDKVFYVGSSGAEACEAAMKMSYQYFYSRGFKKKSIFISRDQSYHGSTSDAMNLGDRPNLFFYKDILNNNVKKVSEHNKYRYQKFNETDEEYSRRSAMELENKIISIGPEKICAFVGETIMGGLVGDVPPNINYWKYVRTICKKYNIHLILDEVWCGTGTSGKIFCIDWDNITPDFLFISKTLAAGYGALSAVLTNSKISNQIFKKNKQIQYSNTHQGFSLSVAAAYEVQKIINNKLFLSDVVNKGKFLRNTIEQELIKYEMFKNVRGRGLRNSFEYETDDNIKFSYFLKKKMLDKNIVIDCKWHRVCLPLALNISKKNLEKNLDIIIETFKKIHSNWPQLRKKIIKKEIFF